MKVFHNFQFRNWAENESCRPDSYFLPETEQEIIEIIKQAKSAAKKIRVVGAGHSWSPVVCTNDFLLSLDSYNKVLEIDKTRKRIRVQAGIRLKEINRILDENGLALVNIGSISEQSIAGVTATGTHGTGMQFQIISSAIVAMRVVNADGKPVEISDALLDAFRVSLGALGIISEITLQCMDKFSLHETSEPLLFDEAMRQLPQLLKDNDHVKLWWFPHVEHLMVYRYRRTQEKAQKRNSLFKWMEDVLLAGYFFALLLRVGNFLPAMIPSVNRFIRLLHLKKVNRVGKSYELFNVPMPPKHRESEYAIPVEYAAQVLHELRKMIEENHLKVNFVVEVRFVKGDQIWLSPAYRRDSCYIGGYLYGDKRWTAYFGLFEKLMKKFDGRPHWGKEFTSSLHDFGKMYERLADFVGLKNELDPQGVFQNRLLKEILGD